MFHPSFTQVSVQHDFHTCKVHISIIWYHFRLYANTYAGYPKTGWLFFWVVERIFEKTSKEIDNLSSIKGTCLFEWFFLSWPNDLFHNIKIIICDITPVISKMVPAEFSGISRWHSNSVPGDVAIEHKYPLNNRSFPFLITKSLSYH